MTQHTEGSEFEIIHATDLFENKGETLWAGRSKVTLGYLLEKVMKTLNEPGLGKRDGAELQTSCYSCSRFYKRINSAIYNVPVVHNSSSQVDIIQVLQEWEGRVLSVGEDRFTARLINMENKSNPEEGDFFIKDICNDDLKLLMPGAIFRWIIGTAVTQGKTEHYYSDIVFRRLSKWSHSELSESDKEARSLSKVIDWQ